jgi:hypothetical protein
VKYEVYESNAAAALVDSEIVKMWEELCFALEQAPVPVYPEKSSKQKKQNLSLVQPMLNALIEQWMLGFGWETQGDIRTLTRGLETEAGTVDFFHRLPDGRYIAVEVQFANGGRLERDYYKLKQLHKHGLLALGIAVYLDKKTGKTADSGLAEYETAVARKGLHGDMPLCIAGLSRLGEREVNLSVLQDIVFPTILGGSGQNEPVRRFVADAIINGADMETLRFPPHLVRIVEQEAMAHTRKALAAVAADMERALVCQNRKLRGALMAQYADFFRSSYSTPGVQRLFKQRAKAQARLDIDLMDMDASAATLTGSRVAPAPIASSPESPPSAAAPSPQISLAEQVLQAVQGTGGAAVDTPCGGYRVKQDDTPPAPRPVLLLCPPPRVADYPTEHFALAGAFSKVFKKR